MYEQRGVTEAAASTVQFAVSPNMTHEQARACTESGSPSGAICPVGDVVFRNGDDCVSVDQRRFHVDCVAAPVASARRRIGGWSAMGWRGHMVMGETQRTPLWAAAAGLAAPLGGPCIGWWVLRDVVTWFGDGQCSVGCEMQYPAAFMHQMVMT